MGISKTPLLLFQHLVRNKLQMKAIILVGYFSITNWITFSISGKLQNHNNFLLIDLLQPMLSLKSLKGLRKIHITLRNEVLIKIVEILKLPKSYGMAKRIIIPLATHHIALKNYKYTNDLPLRSIFKSGNNL